MVGSIDEGRNSFIFQKPMRSGEVREALKGLMPAPGTGGDEDVARANLDTLAAVFELVLSGSEDIAAFRGVAAFSDGQKVNEVRYVGAIDIKTRDAFVAGNGICRYNWPSR